MTTDTVKSQSERLPTASSHILFVCRANQCRSPMMELLFTAAAGQPADQDASSGPTWSAASAGTYSRTGLPAHPYVTRVLAERGIDTQGWSSRTLTADLVNQADLVLTADLDRRRDVVRLAPSAVSHTFPLLAFASWLGLADPVDGGDERPHVSLVARAVEGRARAQALSPRAQNLADPLGRRLRQFRACRDQIADALALLV